MILNQSNRLLSNPSLVCLVEARADNVVGVLLIKNRMRNNLVVEFVLDQSEDGLFNTTSQFGVRGSLPLNVGKKLSKLGDTAGVAHTNWHHNNVDARQKGPHNSLVSSKILGNGSHFHSVRHNQAVVANLLAKDTSENLLGKRRGKTNLASVLL